MLVDIVALNKWEVRIGSGSMPKPVLLNLGKFGSGSLRGAFSHACVFIHDH